MPKNKNKQYTYIDLFCGAGGFSLGFDRVGFRNLFSLDSDREFCKTFAHNFPKHNLIIDKVENLKSKTIKNIIKEPVNVIIGGPPCQGFSIAGNIGRKFINDKRNYLFKEFVRVVKEVQPDFLVMENVARLYTHNKGSTRMEIINAFQDIGYYVECKILNASDYGVPQHRRRVFFIGKKQDQFSDFNLTSGPVIKFPEKDCDNPKTIKEAINDLPRLKSGKSDSKYMNHVAMNHTKEMLKKMSFLSDGGDRSQMPRNIMPTSGDVRKYVKYNSSEPSICVTGDMRKVFHYLDNRALTIRELARLQTFPDWFEFKSTSISQQQQLGNAVPPLLAEKIAKSIIDMICNND